MEKTTRAALKSDFDRAVMSNSGGGDKGSSGSTLVILDSLNYIKGYRYELYCISKAAGGSHGVVWIMGDSSDGDGADDLAKKRNRERKMKHQNNQAENGIDLDGYFEDDGTMDSLVLRYEPPDEKNRWENPLYKVNVTNVLPWGKDGSTLEVSSDPNHPVPKSGEKDEAERGELLASQMKAMDVKDVSGQTSSVPTKPVRKSASGFKRRGKKSVPQGSTTTQQPQSTTTTATPTAPINVPSSMASRNLTPGASGSVQDQPNGSKQKMEDVIDGILDSFLMNTAPLKEGTSTLKNNSADSNLINQVDNLTQRVNNEILKGQKAASLSAGVGGRIFITLSNGSGSGDDGSDERRRGMNLSKALYMNELRNFRRQFLKWIAGHPMPDGTKEEEIVGAYVSYIESHI